jgi:hypothetical protein
MKLSVTFVKQKCEAIEHLKTRVFPINEAQAIAMFPAFMAKIRVELKGEEKRHTFTRPDGKTVTARVVMFPDNSFASVPNVRELYR